MVTTKGNNLVQYHTLTLLLFKKSNVCVNIARK